MGRRFRAITAHRHAAPAPGMGFGAIIEYQGAGRSFAGADQAKIAVADEIADRRRDRLQQALGARPSALLAPAQTVRRCGLHQPIGLVARQQPIAELRRLSARWEPMMEGYVKRCLDPENSPAAASIEGHITR